MIYDSNINTSILENFVFKVFQFCAVSELLRNMTDRYTLEEVSKHTTKDDCWIIIEGKVLNVTKFLNEHPGGTKALLMFAGKDATPEFSQLHEPWILEKYGADLLIGSVGEELAAGLISGGAQLETSCIDAAKTQK